MAVNVPIRQLFIGGEWKEPLLKNRIPIINPSTQETIGDIPTATAEDVEVAVAAARKALIRNKGQEWASASGSVRAKYLRAITAKNLEGSLKPAPKGGLQFTSVRGSFCQRQPGFLRRKSISWKMKPSVSGTSRSAGNQRFPATGSLLQSRQSKLQTLGILSEEEFLRSDYLPKGRTSSLSGRSRPLPSKRYNQDTSAKLRPQTLRPSHSSSPAQPRKRPLSRQLHSAPESLGLETKPSLPQATDHENVSKSRSESSLSLAEELSTPANEINRNIQMVNRSFGAFGPEQSKRTKSPPSLDPSSGSALNPTFSSDPNIAENSTSDAVDNKTKQSPGTSRSAPSPVSSLLSTLVAKGLISAVKTGSSVPASLGVPVLFPKQRKDDTPTGLASNTSPY